MQGNSQLPHPRRPPAHLSVSLRQNATNKSSSRSLKQAEEGHSFPIGSPPRKTSDNSDRSGEGVQNWFDRSNKRIDIDMDQRCQDSESPYFLHQHSSSNTSNVVSEAKPQPSCAHHHAHPEVTHSDSKGSSGDFRSVIDDLTIENRKLKERLKKYEASYSSNLEKDMLFEVKIHGLPARKKRELEETLRTFAASLDSSSDASAKLAPSNLHHRLPAKNTSSSSSLTRPLDSAYASMSASDPTSASTLNRIGADRNAHNQRSSETQRIQSFLHDMPEGPPPNDSLVMTERQRKRLVVRRLEQLFTGKKGLACGDHSQPLQQQKVSESAAMADRTANFQRASVEGVREAHILPFEMETDKHLPSRLESNSSCDMDVSIPSESAIASVETSLEQRPTRPLDLDPDRAQIPLDNAKYIRHLGLSGPSFEQDKFDDSAADDEGWIYLNLLINMAQLHIINVTPDFVRSAVADVSDKFQLSRDGRKIRWRGGTDGTRFSSDGGTSQDGSPLDSDRPDESDRKRRKIDAGRFAPGSARIIDQQERSKAARHDPLHYKPLFHRRKSSSDESTSSEESEPPVECGFRRADENRSRRLSGAPRWRNRGSHLVSGGETRRNNGPIVFYSNTQFCTDLSGDRGTISTPLHKTGVGQDGYSNHTRDALGCVTRPGAPAISRTPSGSVLPFRPFKDYSKGFDPFITPESRPKTPDLLVKEDSDLDMSLEWASKAAPIKAPVKFNASGLGGTQPADHFAVRVETRRTKLDRQTQFKLSKFSAPGPRSKKFLHTIPDTFLEIFKQSDVRDSKDISSLLASLQASSPPERRLEGLPVRTETLSAQFFRLQPSALPPPTGYYTSLSSSESDLNGYSDSSFSGISHLRKQELLASKSPSIVLGSKSKEGDSEFDEDEEDEDDDSDESIDMLASARAADPQTVAAREEEFEREAVQRLEELPTGSSAAAVIDWSSCASGYSSPETESSDEY